VTKSANVAFNVSSRPLYLARVVGGSGSAPGEKPRIIQKLKEMGCESIRWGCRWKSTIKMP